MHHRSRQWTLRLTTVAAAAVLSAGAVSPAAAVECDADFFRPATCAKGTSVARLNAFLTRPVDRPAFYHLDIDMTGGDIGAVAWAVDENGNDVTDVDAVVADKDPDPNQFTGVPYSDLFGGNDSTLIDEEAEFTHPLDMVGIHISVI